jgi:hypothetical protein
MGAKLIQLTGSRATYTLQKNVTTIGRGPENDIILKDERVSKVHARIVRQQNEYYLEDLDSRNGTFFEGKSIIKVHLQADDEFQIGPIAFQFVKVSEAESGVERMEHGHREDSAFQEGRRVGLPSSMFFYYPVIRALNNGEILCAVVGFVFQLIGILVLVGGLYEIVGILKDAFARPTEVTIGGIILSVVLLAGLLAVAQVFFYRARNVRDLGASDYTVIPIIGYLSRALGESVATMGAAFGIGGCLYIWFARGVPPAIAYSLVPLMSAETAFGSGLILLVWMIVYAFVALIIAYFLAESTVVIVDIAKNVQAMRTRAETTQQDR